MRNEGYAVCCDACLTDMQNTVHITETEQGISLGVWGTEVPSGVRRLSPGSGPG